MCVLLLSHLFMYLYVCECVCEYVCEYVCDCALCIRRTEGSLQVAVLSPLCGEQVIGSGPQG